MFALESLWHWRMSIRVTTENSMCIVIMHYSFYYPNSYVFLNGRLFQPDDSTLRVITRSDWDTRNGPISRDVAMMVTPAVQVSCSLTYT